MLFSLLVKVIKLPLMPLVYILPPWHFFMLDILMLKIVNHLLRKNALTSLLINGQLKSLLLNVIYMLLKAFNLFHLVLNLSGVLNSLLVILKILLLMMLIFLNASVLVINLKLFIKVFGPNLSNIRLSNNSLKHILMKELR